jgi:hypothetical protein
MRLPPALTWTHLLPANTEWSFATAAPAPDWFRQQLAARSSTLSVDEADRPRALIAWGARPNQAELKRASAVVGVDAPMLDAAAANSTGFVHVRQFAVLPDIESARWFIPLDNPAVSCAGFSLYSPARASAKLKVAAAKLAIRSHTSIWYRHRLWIAQRQSSQLEQAIATLFPKHDVRLALSSGAPEPARNRKTSAAVLDLRSGQCLGFAKIAVSQLARSLLENEQRVLRHLQANEQCAQLSPALLFGGRIDGAAVTVQQPLTGRASGLEMSPLHRELLNKLSSGRMISAASSTTVRSLREKIAALPVSARPQLHAMLRDLSPALERLSVPSTIVHGDFAPWNLRRRVGLLAAFDWEYGQLDGLPLIDQTHFRLQVGFLLQNWSVERALHELRRNAMNHPDGFIPEQASLLQAVYLLDAVARLLSEGYDTNNDMVAWYMDLLARTMTSTQRRTAPIRAEAVVA